VSQIPDEKRVLHALKPTECYSTVSLQHTGPLYTFKQSLAERKLAASSSGTSGNKGRYDNIYTMLFTSISLIINTFATPLQSNKVKTAMNIALQWAATVIGVFLKRKSFHEDILASYITIRCLDTDSRDRALGNLEVESVKSSIGPIIRRNEEVNLEMGRRRK
jgi:hypothetical protein